MPPEHFFSVSLKLTGGNVMSFILRNYTAPDFNEERFINAPEAVLKEAPKDGVAPEGYHAMSIFP